MLHPILTHRHVVRSLALLLLSRLLLLLALPLHTLLLLPRHVLLLLLLLLLLPRLLLLSWHRDLPALQELPLGALFLKLLLDLVDLLSQQVIILILKKIIMKMSLV